MTTDNRTSVFIEEQFPLFARSSGQKLIAFIKNYYESQEQANNYIEAVHSLLDYQDIDTAPEEYFDYIAKEILPNIPKRLITNRDLLAKHIKEVYKVRGSPVGYRILFRALFGEEIEIYNPGDDILRASDGRWVEEVAIKVEYVVNGTPDDLPGVRLVGQESGASAIVNRIELIEDLGVKLWYVYFIDIVGTFILGERLTSVDGVYSVDLQPGAIGPISKIAMTADGGYGHEVGDRLNVVGGSGGSGAEATVLTTRADSAVEFYVANGGSGYAVGALFQNEPTVLGGTGTGAAFIVSDVGPPFVGYPVFDDVIEYALTANLNQSNTAANVTFVQAYDSNCTFNATDNRIYKPNHGFEDNDIVRFFFITGNTQYIGVDDWVEDYDGVGDPWTINAAANSYVVREANSGSFRVGESIFFTILQDIFEGGPGIHGRVSRMTANLALSNVNSQIITALGTSIVNTGTITNVTTTDGGYGYYDVRPIGRVRYDLLADQKIANNMGIPGGFLGDNADIQTIYKQGTIASVIINLQGDNYITSDIVGLYNLTREQTEEGFGIATASSIIRFLGRYVDTKGWLSWDKYLQDNYYYQEFSYEIRSEQNFRSYKDTLLNTLHPAGTKLFGGVYFEEDLDLSFVDDNEIMISFEILNSNLTIEVAKSIPVNGNSIVLAQVNANTGDTISSNNNIFQNVQANDKVYITGSYLSDGTYTVKSVVDSNTISLFDNKRTVKLLPSIHGDVGFGFKAGNVIVSNTTIRGLANVGDTINITNAINEQNNGGPFLITNKDGANLVIQSYYGGCTSPFVAYTGDKVAKISLDRNFAFLANTNANVSFTAVGNLVTRNSHEFSNSDGIVFYNISNTTQINLFSNNTYYVLNTTLNTFQLAANTSAVTSNTVVDITSDGKARLEANNYNIVIYRYANTYPYSNTTVL